MINIDGKELKRLIEKGSKKKITTKQIEDALFDFGMEIKNQSNTGEWEIEIKAERSDMVSLQGVARALRAYLEISPGMPKWQIKKLKNSEYEVNVDSSVAKVRPYTVAAVIKGLKFDDKKIKEVIWVQEKLHQTIARQRKKGAIGIYPMETIKWPISYKALKPEQIKFKPLEATKEMTGAEIIQKHPTGKEYAHLLSDKSIYPIFVDSNNEILSMPPVINSEKTGRVNEKTKDIFIECSGFDLNFLSDLLNILVTMFADMGGGIYSVDVNYKNQISNQKSIKSKKLNDKANKSKTYPDLTPYEKIVDVKTANNTIGFNLNSKEAQKLLKKMMYDIVSVNGDKIKVKVPRIRTDIWHEIDIIDDLTRAYGFNNLKPTFPNVSTIGETLPLSDLKENLSELLMGLGFLETYTFGLTSIEDQYVKMNLISEDKKPFKDYIPLKDSAEKGLNVIRTWMIPEQLKCLRNNMNNSLPQKIFDCNFVVIPNNSKDVLSENVMKLSAMITNNVVTFTEIKQILDNLMLSLDIKITLEPIKHPSFLEGRTGKILVGKKEIGIIGEINPVVLQNFGLANPVVAFELNVDEILELLNK